MELISEECVEGDGNRVDERPNELFSSSISKIFTTNHVQQVKKKKMKEKKEKKQGHSLCLLSWGLLHRRGVSYCEPQARTCESVLLGSFELFP